MAATTKKWLKEGYERLKKTWEKLIRQNKNQDQPQLVLQPVRNPHPRFRIASAGKGRFPVAGKEKKN